MSTKSKFQAIEISLLHIAFSITYQKFITENRSLIKINQFLFFFDEFGLVLHFFIGDGKVYFLILLKYLVGMLFQPVEWFTFNEATV